MLSLVADLLLSSLNTSWGPSSMFILSRPPALGGTLILGVECAPFYHIRQLVNDGGDMLWLARS